MSHHFNNNMLIGWVAATMLATFPLLTWATDDTTTHRLLDSEGKPILTGESQECVQTPNSVNYSKQHFQVCGDTLDRDGDGVPDEEDQCLDNSVLEIAKGVYGDRDHPESGVSKKGCPLDMDEDGVPDYRDECPQTPLIEQNCVDERGCTRDDDQDGITNCIDQCPHTPLAQVVNAQGCVNIIAVTKTILGSDVTFGFGQYQLTQQGQLELDKIAQSVISELPLVETILIVGHTDSVGSDRANQQLSERRANAVATYLINRGIPTTLVKLVGRGEQEPIADNQSKIGRAKNRRVEITINTKKLQ